MTSRYLYFPLHAPCWTSARLSYWPYVIRDSKGSSMEGFKQEADEARPPLVTFSGCSACIYLFSRRSRNVSVSSPAALPISLSPNPKESSSLLLPTWTRDSACTKRTDSLLLQVCFLGVPTLLLREAAAACHPGKATPCSPLCSSSARWQMLNKKAVPCRHTMCPVTRHQTHHGWLSASLLTDTARERCC